MHTQIPYISGKQLTIISMETITKINFNCDEHYKRLFFVLEGSVRHHHAEKIDILNQGMFWVFNNDAPYFLEPTDTPNICLSILVDKSLFGLYTQELMNFHIDCNSLTCKENELRPIISYLAQLVYIVNNVQENQSIIFNKTLNLLINYLITYFAFSSEILPNNVNNIENNIDRKFLQIFNFTQKNYQKNISLNDLSNHINFSKYYISHILQKKGKGTFQQLLNWFRGRHAVKLLINTNMSILDISLESGFPSNRSLYNTFMNMFKTSPSKYRKDKLNLLNNSSKKNWNSSTLETFNEKGISFLMQYLSKSTIKSIINFQPKQNIIIDFKEKSNALFMQHPHYIPLKNLEKINYSTIFNRVKEMKNEMKLDYICIEDIWDYIYSESNSFTWLESLTLIYKLSLIPYFIIELERHWQKYLYLIKNFYNEAIDLFPISWVKEWTFDVYIPYPLSKDKKDFFYNQFNNELIKINVNTVSKSNTQDIKQPVNMAHPITATFNLQKALFHPNTYWQAYLSDSKNGLITKNNGIKKYSYYAYYLFTKLKGMLIKNEPGFVITRDEEGISILLYDISDLPNIYNKDIPSEVSNYYIQFKNQLKDCSLVLYELTPLQHSEYFRWHEFDCPDKLSIDQTEMLNKSFLPNKKVIYRKKSLFNPLEFQLSVHGILLIQIKEIRNFS